MNFWIFQAVPERYNLVDKMNSLPSEHWFVTRYSDEIKATDVVYFWQAGKVAGLYGWGVVQSPGPYLAPDGDHRVQVSYQVRFVSPSAVVGKVQAPIPKEMVKQDSRLSKLQILQAPQGTNFGVEPREAIALNQLIREAGFTAPPDPAPTGEDDHA